MANPNFGLWSGNCINLTGRGCAVGDASGNLNETFGPLIIGETYLIQISGNSPFIQGTFSLELNNNLDCSGCLEVGFLTANPPPINGAYSAGQTVEFCYTITDYNQTGAVWLHGVQVEWGAGWETTVNDVATTVPPSCSGSGSWTWVPGGVTGTGPNAGTFPSGFYYESNSGCSPIPCDPNDPGDNYGDSGAENCDPQFCWTLTTLPPISCSSSVPLTLTVNTSADNESGSYIGTYCQSDLTTEYSSMLSCCAEPPTISAVDVSCGSSAPEGSATVQAVGSALPWTYQWYDDSGTLISTTSFSSLNSNTITNLVAGDYTAVVTDNTGCSSGNVVTVAAPVETQATFAPLNYICAGEPLNLPAASQEGFTGTWSPAVNNTATTTYTFTPDAGQCALPTTLTVVVRPAPTIDPIADFTACNGDIINLNAVLAGIGTSISWSSTGGNFSNPTSTSTTFTPTILSGTTTITAVASSIICTITNQEEIEVTVSDAVISDFLPIADICPGDAIVLPSTSTNGITGSWSPAVDNTTTTTYTFTPDPGQCATSESMTVNVGSGIVPSFDPIADICSGDALSLPGTSTNSISGTWSPAVNNTATTNYTFTPNAGQCATTQGLTVNVNAQTTPSFSPIADICSGDALSLPGTSTNSISGTWSPAVNNTATTNYT
ncbi:MAG: hypothetical protein L7T85_05390, partial [Flavobacteriaceae bacterium]|nr:hypothetical protein [Flavobacteriaceae bacterium]